MTADGTIGSDLCRRATAAWSGRRSCGDLRAEGYENLLTATREQLDLRDQAAVNYWFRANRPEYVFLVAGTVGGILANSTRPAEFLYDNMMIHAHGRSCRASLRRQAAAVSRELLHLSARVPAADEGGVPAERPAGIDQRSVRARQDRRHQVVPELSQAVRLRLHRGDADESVRSARQLRPHELARPAGADAQVPRREGGRPRRGGHLGHGDAAP